MDKKPSKPLLKIFEEKKVSLHGFKMEDMLNAMIGLGNAKLTLNDGQLEDVQIGCKYDPASNTLTPLTVGPINPNDFAFKLKDYQNVPTSQLAIAQRLCSRAVDLLDIASAYKQFGEPKQRVTDSNSRRMLDYLAKHS